MAPEPTRDEGAYYEGQRRLWRRVAPLYDRAVRPLRRLRRKVAARIGARPPMRILDVATGTGEQALAFADAGAEVVGIDLSPEMLEVARRKLHGPNVSFEVADAAALPFPDESFDAAGISFGLHEMPRSVRERSLRELARVTRPGGAIVVVDWRLPRNAVGRAIVPRVIGLFEHDSYPEFIRSDLPASLRHAGVELVSDEPVMAGVGRILVGRRHAVARGTRGEPPRRRTPCPGARDPG